MIVKGCAVVPDRSTKIRTEAQGQLSQEIKDTGGARDLFLRHVRRG